MFSIGFEEGDRAPKRTLIIDNSAECSSRRTAAHTLLCRILALIIATVVQCDSPHITKTSHVFERWHNHMLFIFFFVQQMLNEHIFVVKESHGTHDHRFTQRFMTECTLTPSCWCSLSMCCFCCMSSFLCLHQVFATGDGAAITTHDEMEMG